MRKQILKTFILSLITICFAATINAQTQTRPYKVRDNQVQYILNRIEARTDTYKRTLNNALDRSRLNGSDSEDVVMNYVTGFENSTDALKQKFDAKESVDADVMDVLTRAAYINKFMLNNRLNTVTQRNWVNLKTDLNTLASYYSITQDWTQLSERGNTVSMPYRVSDDQVETILGNIETRTDTFKRSLDRALDRGRLDGTDSEDTILNYIEAFENNTDQLKRKFDDKTSVATDVQNVLDKAYFIDGYVENNRLNRRSKNIWATLKADLNTLASYYNVNYGWTGPVNNPGRTDVVYKVPTATVKSTLSMIETRTDNFKREMNTALDRSILNNSKSEDSVVSYITEFENATDRLKQNFDANRSTSADVEEVLNKAYYINGFMRDYRFDRRAEREWNLLKNDLSSLRDYYSVNFDFENRQYEPVSEFDKMLTGTYRLNVAQSDNVEQVVAGAVRYYPAAQKERIERNLERRLGSPDMLAVEKRDDMVTVASSNAPQVSFEADGVVRNETNNRGRQIKVTANTYYDGVSLSYESDRANDFYVNFMPMRNGQLKVIRRVYLENRNDTVTVASVYDKTDQVANLSMVRNDNTASNNNSFVVPNNTPITAILKTPISTKASQDNDRFMLEVTSPSRFNGAVIEGRVIKAERSGRVSGKANISMEFDTIRLRNGKTYNFAGIIENVSPVNGDDIKINNEGTVRDGNQTTKTVTRAGIGAALGALIGAIAGGGEGAAIGAAVGAGAGAGTVILEGRDDINLEQGSQFTLTATAPTNNTIGR